MTSQSDVPTSNQKTVDGKKYVVCDPSYINADVGMSMSRYKGSSAEIIKL